MKGAIIVNGYYKSNSYTYQVNRIKDELNKIDIDVLIYENNKPILIGQSFDWDFAIFLDKDINFAKMLENSGVVVINNSNAIEIADNKIKTNIFLDKYKIKMPITIPAPKQYLYKLDENFLDEVIEKLKFPLIVKSAYGSLGMQVYKANSKDELIEIENLLKNEEHCYQECIKENLGQSIRAILIDKKVICAMQLKNTKDFRSNANLGGTAVDIKLNDKQIKVAEKVAKLMDLDYCGIDFFVNSEMLIEVNSNAFFARIEEVCNQNVAKCYANYIKKKMEK